MYSVMGYNTEPMIQPTRRGVPHVPEVRPAPDCLRTARPDPHRPGPRRTPAPAPVASRARPRPAPVRRGPAGRGVDGRSRRGCVGRLGGQREPLAASGRGPRAGRGAGAPAQGVAAPSAGWRGRSATPAVGPVRAAGRPGARDVAGAGPRVGDAGDGVPHQLRDGAPRAKKKN